MQNENARQYLTALGEAIAPQTIAWGVQETEDGPVLVFTGPSPIDEASTFGYFVTLSSYTDEIVLFELEVTVFTDIDETLFEPLKRAVNAVNNALILGSFYLYEETAEIVYRQGVFFGNDLNTGAATDNIVKTLAVMENGAVNGGAELMKLIKGECTADELIASLNDVGGEA